MAVKIAESRDREGNLTYIITDPFKTNAKYYVGRVPNSTLWGITSNAQFKAKDLNKQFTVDQSAVDAVVKYLEKRQPTRRALYYQRWVERNEDARA